MRHVWYAAYGSNLSRERFDVYMSGGRPEGATHTYPGCRNPAPPMDDVPGVIDTELAFGGWSQTWGGGVAFVRDRPGALTRARLYLLTLEQFEDVVAQENWLIPGSVTIEPSEEQVVLDGDHTYRLVMPLGKRDGTPILTVSQLVATETAPPTVAYLTHIAHGLRESHGMTHSEIVSYLADAPGAPPPEDIAIAVP
jgi:hypothetical protein